MKDERSGHLVAQHVTITGVVQGVGFRPFVYNLATESSLAGWVLNHSGGVELEVEGPEDGVTAFIVRLSEEAPPLARIASVDSRAIAPVGHIGFEIRHSESQAGRYQLVSPDVATCPDCLRELLDPGDRRYRYPFINCTNCGPRFTIIEDIPYDRPATTMRVFPMCDACLAEYTDPRNRRFHAQPNACPVCGPHVWLVEAKGSATTRTPRPNVDHGSGVEGRPAGPQEAVNAQHALTGDAALVRAADLLRSGKILAIKGLGGFHLACDATNAEAVALLRRRKHRPGKPFALMVATLEDARALGEVPPEAEALMTSAQCPIVLLDARPESPIAPEVAPASHTLGVMLPTTPLHHILLRDVGRPLVMTSGNLSEEPIAKDNDEALARLAPLADAFLLHNRDIHARYDDTVVQIGRWENRQPSTSQVAKPGPDAQPPTSSVRFVRRARGYAPYPIRLPFSAPQIYAAGPLLKNTFTLTRDDYAFVSQHIGDLENLETLEHYEEALATYQHLFRIEPGRVVCDLHFDYMSTRLAEAFAVEHGLPAPLRIQHHQAHIAACLAENDWPTDQGPVIGVALDGTGYGEDGEIWGGEWFIGDYRGFERAAHLAYLPLPGGDAAIRHPWRIGVAYLHALDADDLLPLGAFCPTDVMQVRTMVDRRLNTPLTSSMGRLFDAVSALLGICHEATYEAQAAIELEQSVPPSHPHRYDGAGLPPYPYHVESSVRPCRVGVGSVFEGILADVARGVPVADIALRFHVTIADMMVTVGRRLREQSGIGTIALSGGVFQNQLLLAHALPRLDAAGFRVLLHQQLPPNDGCISLGQAAMAAVAEADHQAE
jgi:hydrogenase maturation protein HypF